MKYIYTIKGMHCSSCVDKIKQAFYPEQIEVTLKPPQLKINKSMSLEELNSKIATAGQYQIEALTPDGNDVNWFKTYYPILLIAIYIFSVALFVSSNISGIDGYRWMTNFMAGFFLVFSAFKMLDLKGFADAYASYDLLAKHVYAYGFIYPFLELALGFLYLKPIYPLFTYSITIVLMGFSSLGVINALMKKQKIRCACLGTILNVPMSSITLVEDLLMVLMALIMLIAMFI